MNKNSVYLILCSNKLMLKLIIRSMPLRGFR